MPPSSWADLIVTLQRDHRSGATALTRQAAAGLPLLAAATATTSSRERTRAALRALGSIRPPFGSLWRLANETAEVLDAANGVSADLLATISQRFTDRLAAQHAAVVTAAQEVIVGARRVLTISASSLVRDTLLAARDGGARPAPLVTCLESRPGLEGVGLAEELAAAGLEVRLAVDAAAARLVEEVDLVLLGGDTCSPSGLIHKLGTYGLALAARERGVPCYALLGTSKLLPAAVRGWQDDGGSPSALLADPPERLEGWNRFFDLTPLGLLDGLIVEAGVLAPEAVADLARQVVAHSWLADLLED